MRRRRFASLVAMAVAAAASLATTPAPPTAPPTAGGSVTGTVELTADEPVAIVPLAVSVAGLAPDSGGTPPGVSFRILVGRDAPAPVAAGDDVRLTVVPAEEGDAPLTPGYQPYFEGSQDRPPAWSLECDAGTCGRDFALLVEWLEPAGGATRTVDWRIETTANLWSGVGGGEARLDLQAGAARPAPFHAAATAVSGDVRLGGGSFLHLWKVTIRLDPVEGLDLGWPLVLVARLRGASDWINPDPEHAGQPVPALFIELGGGRGRTYVEDLAAGIAWEPFVGCEVDVPCEVEAVVGLALWDRDPAVELEASWELEATAIAADGEAIELSADAEPVPPMPMLTAGTTGRLVLSDDRTDGPLELRVVETGTGQLNRGWGGLPLPARGVLRLRATSTGDDPADGVSIWLRHVGLLRLDQDVVTAFPIGDDDCRVGECELLVDFDPSIGDQGAAPNWEITIDWELDVAVGTRYAEGRSTLAIEAVPR